MKGRFKITVIDLDMTNILIDEIVDDLEFGVSRPLIPIHDPGSYVPKGFTQRDPMIIQITGKKEAPKENT